MQASQSRGSKVSRTQWTAQFLAASELVRNDYVVSFTMGNHTPLADLMVATQDGSRQFWIDVKGQSANNAWFVRRRQEVLPHLFYVLVRVGRTRGEDRFFILSHQNVADLIAKQDRVGEAKGQRDMG